LEVDTPAEVQQANTSTFGRKKQHHKMQRLGSVPNCADDVLVSTAREPRAYTYVYIFCNYKSNFSSTMSGTECYAHLEIDYL
jgi:hypothetical protein